MHFSNQPAQAEETGVLEDTVLSNRLILHNDDINTFEWVSQTLVEICEHTWEQAEQCSYIIHHKGKYAVKHGSFEKLKPMQDAIAERGINVTIE